MCLCAVVCCGSISLKENRKLEVGKDLRSSDTKGSGWEVYLAG